jgi:hypothetical protein
MEDATMPHPQSINPEQHIAELKHIRRPSEYDFKRKTKKK